MYVNHSAPLAFPVVFNYTMADNITKTVNYMYELSYFAIPAITIAFIGTLSNVLLLVAFVRDPLKRFRNSATYLVANLAISDCATCLISLLLHFILEKLGREPISGLCIHWFANVSCVSIASISIDRFLMIAYPIKHRILMEGRVMILWLTVIWVGSSALPSLSLLRGHQRNDLNAVFIFRLTFIVLSAGVYSWTYRKLKTQSRNITSQNSSATRAQEIRTKKEKRFLKTIIMIACIAFFSLVPTNVFFVLHAARRGESNLASRIGEQTSLCIFYGNFAVNPLIYVLRLPNYRKTFHLVYCRRAS